MPLTHTSTFKVRFYECDPYGHVNNTNYLRYMQDAAFEASAAAGYDTHRYELMGRMWYAHATDIEYIRPLKYGDCVEVRTWVMDFRRVTSRRAYEMRQVETGDLVAKATTDWAFLDSTTEKPAAIPLELLQHFFPEGLPEQHPHREKFPAASPPPNGVWTLRRRVRWADLDPARHVNNAVYAEYVEDCGLQSNEAFGWPVSRMIEHGFGIFYRRMWLEYVQPAVLGDELDIAVWISDVRRATAMRHFTITRTHDGALLARVHVIGACADIATGAPRRIPQELLDDFALNIAQSSPSLAGRG
jgi:acyl-CoA thioester hydrolase